MDINKILEIAPAKISEYCEAENNYYALMLRKHEEYKRERARKYLVSKVQGETIKDLEYKLDCDDELSKIKNAEISAEIEYRNQRMKKEKAKDIFQSALELGRTARQELRSLHDTISTKED